MRIAALSHRVTLAVAWYSRDLRRKGSYCEDPRRGRVLVWAQRQQQRGERWGWGWGVTELTVDVSQRAERSLNEQVWSGRGSVLDMGGQKFLISE